MASVCRVVLVVLGLLSTSLNASEALTVAVAANFAPSLRVLVANYEAQTQRQVVVVSGSTGKLATQIKQGAPYDLFFAADESRPRQLELEGLAVKGSRVTYALGRLVLWQPAGVAPTIEKMLASRQRVAIANPRLAPYGVAAENALREADAWDQLTPRLVIAENVMQVYQYARTGQVGWALLPLSLVLLAKDVTATEYSLLAKAEDRMIKQQAVVIRSGRVEAAEAFLAFCMSKDSRNYLQQAGYGLSDAQQ